MTSLNNAANSGMGYNRVKPYQDVGGSGYGFDNKNLLQQLYLKAVIPHILHTRNQANVVVKKEEENQKL